MCATAANLIERVLPQTGLRQWVSFSWRRRLAQDGALLGRLSRIFAETVHAFYAERAAKEGISGAKTGSVTVVQRTSSDLRLNPPERERIPPGVFESDYPLPRFDNVAREVGLYIFGMAGGAILEDFDNDGDLDVITSFQGLAELLEEGVSWPSLRP